MSTNAENLVKLGPVVAEIFGAVRRFLAGSSKSAVVTPVLISGVTEPILVKFAQDVAKILPLNIFESEWTPF